MISSSGSFPSHLDTTRYHPDTDLRVMLAPRLDTLNETQRVAAFLERLGRLTQPESLGAMATQLDAVPDGDMSVALKAWLEKALSLDPGKGPADNLLNVLRHWGTTTSAQGEYLALSYLLDNVETLRRDEAKAVLEELAHILGASRDKSQLGITQLFGQFIEVEQQMQLKLDFPAWENLMQCFNQIESPADMSKSLKDIFLTPEATTDAAGLRCIRLLMEGQSVMAPVLEVIRFARGLRLDQRQIVFAGLEALLEELQDDDEEPRMCAYLLTQVNLLRNGHMDAAAIEAMNAEIDRLDAWSDEGSDAVSMEAGQANATDSEHDITISDSDSDSDSDSEDPSTRKRARENDNDKPSPAPKRPRLDPDAAL